MDTLSAPEFLPTLQKGTRFFTHPILLINYANPLSNAQLAKIGFTVPKRYLKKAVHRNRIKRVMRAVVQEMLKNQPKIFTGWIIFSYTDKTVLPFEVIKNAMLQCIQKMQE
ncbi:hypothetical protein AGMMS4956_03420 [Bacteroidia bacterium]|nr:hypothetical protein AGMMS4956_03420 [Bacteroidia bacterium]